MWFLRITRGNIEREHKREVVVRGDHTLDPLANCNARHTVLSWYVGLRR